MMIQCRLKSVGCNSVLQRRQLAAPSSSSNSSSTGRRGQQQLWTSRLLCRAAAKDEAADKV